MHILTEQYNKQYYSRKAALKTSGMRQIETTHLLLEAFPKPFPTKRESK